MASRPGPPRRLSRAQLSLALLGALSMLPPYVGPALGLDLDVRPVVEVVDHVVPGALAALCAGLAALRSRLSPNARPSALILALSACAFLAGVWQTATHAPLVAQAGEGQAPWGAVLMHSTAGPLIALLALWLTLQAVVDE